MSLTKSIFGIHNPTHKLALLVGDSALMAMCFHLASKLRLDAAPQFLSLEYMGLNLIVIGSLFLGGAYTSTRIRRRPKLPLNTFFIVIASSMPSVLFIYILGPERYTSLLGRGVYPIAMLAFGFLAVVNHYVLNMAFYRPSHDKYILLLGNSQSSAQLGVAMKTRSQTIELRHSAMIQENEHQLTEIGAIVVSPDHRPDEKEQQLLLDYRLKGLPIYSISEFFEYFFFLVPVQEIDNDWFIRSQGFAMQHSSTAVRVKRLVDVLCSLALIVISLPVLLLTSIAVKLTSKGSIFFAQTRVGIQGDSFVLYKFRTMIMSAESEGAKWASKDDSRVTNIGRFLRATRIDELPQCWNILKGEMSFIGPRPERPEFTSMLAEQIPYYDLRHIVKPGLTGWAQVCYPYGASVEDALRKLQYDLYYIKNYSILLDLNILLRTVLVTVRRMGR